LNGEAVLFHASNLRQPKRIDLLLESVSRIQTRRPFKLLVLAGDDFSPYLEQARRLGLVDRIIVREKVVDVEDYLQVADIGVFTSESESFCLTILECMFFGVPSVAFEVGGIPEVINDRSSGVLVSCGDVEAHSRAIAALLDDEAKRSAIAKAAKARANERFSTDTIVSKYEDLYRRIKK
jgi:glycosyltransferase involved in cell wall biosynthesis